MRNRETVALYDPNIESIVEFTKNKLLSFFRVHSLDEGGFRSLVGPLKKNLYNFILKSVNYSEDAEDIFQEVLLRSFKYFYSLKEKSSFPVWIFSIAHNEIKRYYKKRREAALVEYSDDMAAGDESQQGMVSEIYGIARLLKPKHREVFFLFYFNEFSIREIGDITGLGEGNIKYILNQARSRIKLALGGTDEDE